MNLEKAFTKREEIPQPQYPVLEKALSGVPEEFALLKQAFKIEELAKHEEQIANGSWKADFLPRIVAEAKRRLAEKAPQ